MDDCDFSDISQYSWCVMKTHGLLYAARNESIAGKKRNVYMHRHILKTRLPHIDHIDGNGLNNCRSNLRPATASQNIANADFKPGVSGYRGVWRGRCNRFVARIEFQKKKIHIGTFVSAEEAARAYDSKARELFKEFARTNF